MMLMRKFVRSGLVPTAILLLAACGGGGSNNGGGGGSGSGGGTTYTVGGTASGLPANATLVLQDNGGDNLTVSANGGYTFATHLANGAAYKVTVLTQPNGATCTVANSSGNVAGADVTNVAVSCSATSGYTVGGTVSGLPGGSHVVLQDNGGDNLTVSANGGFNFPTALANGAAYKVTILTQPGGATCGLVNASGNIASASVSNVAVTCASTATTGSTAFSALSIGNARIALVPLNLTGSANVGKGVLPVAIDGTSTLTGTFVATTFPIESCSTDSANLLAVCINYLYTTVAILDLSKFATSFNVADIVDHEFDTGAPTTGTSFSGVNCQLCGVVAVPSLKSFVVSAYDGYRVYAYPAAGAVSPLKPSKTYAVPITENFALSATHGWLISPDYYADTTTNLRSLRVIDLVKMQAYSWTVSTNVCATTDPAICANFTSQVVDSAAYSDDTNLLTLDSEVGDAQLTVDMSQAVFNGANSTFTAPYAYSDLTVVDNLGLGDMSGILASSVGHWGFAVAEFAGSTIGVQQFPASGGTGGTLTVAAPNPVYLTLSNLTNYAPCTAAPAGGGDPHAQGYTLTNSGVPLGLFISGDSRCVAVINFALLYAAPRQASPNNNLIDLTSYDPVKAGAITFYAVPAE